MQLSDLRTAVRIRAGFDSADAMATDAILTELINASIREVTNARDWDWNKSSETINTVAGTAAYARAADCRTTVRIEDATDKELLRQTTPKNAVRYKDFTGRPAFWYVEAGQINLVPTPNTVRALTHTYLASETALSGDSDEPDIPDYAIDAVIIKAAMKLAARTDNTSLQRLLAQDHRDVMEGLANDARRAKGAPIIDTRRDWGRQG